MIILFTGQLLHDDDSWHGHHVHQNHHHDNWRVVEKKKVSMSKEGGIGNRGQGGKMFDEEQKKVQIKRSTLEVIIYWW